MVLRQSIKGDETFMRQRGDKREMVFDKICVILKMFRNWENYRNQNDPGAIAPGLFAMKTNVTDSTTKNLLDGRQQ